MDGILGATKIRNFKDDLAFSELASEEPFWQAVYRKAFTDMVGNIQCKGKCQGQHLGIDRLIYLKSGKTLYIDEKKRRKVYPDFDLEYLSVDKTGAPGWIEKDLLIDYLAYAFMPLERCYLFPWHLLKRVWRNFGTQWKEKAQIKRDGFSIIKSDNGDYNTYGVGVPIKILTAEIKNATIIQL